LILYEYVFSSGENGTTRSVRDMESSRLDVTTLLLKAQNYTQVYGTLVRKTIAGRGDGRTGVTDMPE
ncbi:hypothetical protein AVEN_262495-1, partial [Araneus ventricosus]